MSLAGRLDTPELTAGLGICKSPNAAGEVGALRYDIIPGRPDESILIYRLESTAPKTSMRRLSRNVVHVGVWS